MNSFNNLLASIAARPAMYVGGRNINAVLTYLYGYNQALVDSGARPGPLDGFMEWVQRRYLVFHQAWGVDRILLHFYGSDRAAIGALPGLHAAFLADRAVLGIDGIIASRDQELTAAYGPFELGLIFHAPEASPTRPSSESAELDRWYHDPDSAA